MKRISQINMFWIKQHKSLVKVIVIIFVVAGLLSLLGIKAAEIIESDRLQLSQKSEETKSPIKANPSYDYGEKGFRTVSENNRFVLSADTTNGEIQLKDKETTELWYSNPQNRADDKLAAVASRLSSQLVLTVVDVASGNSTTIDNYAASIKRGGMKYELIENGILFTFSFPKQGIVIPVSYTLTDSGFSASVLADKIQELWSSAYLLQNVDFLPFFGAGGLEDKGYLVVPDGSGAVMNFNNGKQRFAAYSQLVYGMDSMEANSAAFNGTQQVYLPIFGIKRNDCAFVSVIEEGASESYIKASVSRKTSSYNQVYSQMTYRKISIHEVLNGNVLMDSGNPLFSEHGYTVNYIMLDKNESDYSGMANRYREYLEDNNKIANQTIDTNYVLALDVYGAISIEEYVMGVKKPVVHSMTSYNDLQKILSELKTNGIQNVVTNYIGALNEGLRGSMTVKFSNQPKLGSRAEMNSLINYSDDNKFPVFFEYDPVYLYKNGNGYSTNKDSVKTFFEAYAYQYSYKLNTNQPDTTSRWYLFKPSGILNLLQTFQKSMNDPLNINISIDNIGKMIYSDYDEQKGLLSRNNTMKQWDAVLSYANKSFDKLLVNGANSYVYPFADIITDVPVSGSEFDMTDYSIPFMQIALHGAIQMYSDSLNFSSDYNKAFLHAAETGCGIKYSVIKNGTSVLINSQYNDLVACNYDNWKETIFDQYHQLSDLVKQVGNQKITKHEILNSGISLTEYENGVKVFVNYNSTPYTNDGVSIPAKSFIVKY